MILWMDLLSHPVNWLWLLAVLALFLQVYYYVADYAGVGFSSRDEKYHNQTLPPVSVVICARNELKNLRAFLPSVLEQDYPEYQVIVVNDCSWDESAAFLEEMEDAHPRLKVVTLVEQERYKHGKKFALTLGIKAAQYDTLLLTDADCRPASSHWISSMVQAYGSGKEIVLGYGAYEKGPGFLNRWIRFDTAQIALLFMGRALRGKAYMGVGRNLSYRKDLFFRNKGFAHHYHIHSGDDDLFINETARKGNVSVCLSPAGFTFSKPGSGLGEWVSQKIRHMSTGWHYRNTDKRPLGMMHVSQYLFFLSLLSLFLLKQRPEFIVGMIAIRLLVQIFIYGKGFQRLGEKDLIPFIPLFDLVQLISYPLMGLASLFTKPKNWK